MASKMSGGFLALQAKKSKEKKKTVDLEDAFRAADTDKDGKLNLDEWVEVLSKTGHSVSRYVSYIVLNLNIYTMLQKLSKYEVRAAHCGNFTICLPV